MLSIRVREYGFELIRCCEMDRIIEPRIRTNTSFELTATAVDLAQELDLQPSLIALNSIGGGQGTRQLSNPY
jgi:hypothetical protein